MTDQQTQSSLPAKITSPALTPGLKALLSVGDERTAINEIVRNPVMLAEARQALPALRASATAGAGPEGVRRVVGNRLALFPLPNLSPPEWQAWWGDYFDALADLSEAALEAAMAAYIRDPAAEFMPKPGRLRALALETPNQAARAYSRAAAAIRKVDTVVEPSTGEKPSKELVDQMLSGFRQSFAERQASRTQPDRPPVRPPVNETGLTRDMRIHLGIEPVDPVGEGEGA